MLGRFCVLSLKTVRLSRILQNKTQSGLCVSSSIFTQKSNYATTTPDLNVNKTRSLQIIITDLKSRVENKTRLTNANLQSLLAKLTTHKANADQALEILRCCSYARFDKENAEKIIEKIWNILKSQNDNFEIQHYNCILNVARNQADIKLAEETFDEIEKNGIKPDVISYQTLLAAYCKVGNIEKAIEVLDMMDKENMYINEATYNNLVQCHIKSGNLDAAHEAVANLKEAGFKPNIFTFDAFLKHYAEVGDLDGIEKTIDRIKEENLELLNRDIFTVICEMAVNGHVEKIDSVLSHVKRSFELRRSLKSAITLFVQKRQSLIIPKILEQADGDVKEKIKFFIEEMVRCSTPESEFNETIAHIEAMGITIENNFDLFKSALDGPSEVIIQRMLNHMQAKSIPVSENCFEKLFQLASEKGVDDVLDIVNLMCTTFKIKPQLTFVRDVILPGLKYKENPVLAFAKLRTTDIRLRTTVLAIVTDNLINKDIKTAYEFASTNVRAFYGLELVRRPLLEAFTSTRDVENFVPFVRLIHNSFSHINGYHKQDQNDTQLTEAQITTKQKAFVGELLWSAISNCRTDTQLVTQVLRSFADEGLSISTTQAEKLQTSLQVESETEIGRLLKKLSTESLRPNEELRRRPANVMSQLNSIDIQNILEVKQAQGHSAAATQKLLFLAYIREGNAAEIESLLAQSKISLSNSDYAKLIELYVRNGNLENALNILNRVCANNATFKLDRIKVAKLVKLMIDKERSFDEIDALLLAHRQVKAEHRIFIFEHLLDQLAEHGHCKLAEQLFDTLLKYSYIEPTTQSTGPLVLSYLNNGKMDEAVTKYEHFASTFKLLPMTIVLFKHLIKSSEIDLLRRVFDAYERVHGEQNAMYRLAFAFVECGQDRQARAILENDRLQNISWTVARECKQYVQYSRVDAAKCLLRATKGLFFDRHIIYQSLLDIYTKNNKASDALELWCDYLTDDGISPRSQFKTGLIALLKANNVEIPPELEDSKNNTNTKQSKETIEKQTITN